MFDGKFDELTATVLLRLRANRMLTSSELAASLDMKRHVVQRRIWQLYQMGLARCGAWRPDYDHYYSTWKLSAHGARVVTTIKEILGAHV